MLIPDSSLIFVTTAALAGLILLTVRRTPACYRRFFYLLALIAFPAACLNEFTPTVHAAAEQLQEESEEYEPADLEISGYGLFGNRKLSQTLKLLDTGGQKPEFFDADYLEDAVILIFNKLKSDGYLSPTVKLESDLVDGGLFVREFREAVFGEIPRTIQAVRAHFTVNEGILYYFKDIYFRGLASITEAEAVRFFVTQDFLFKLKGTRIYSPDRLKSGTQNLVESLHRLGYENASATVTRLDVNHKTGAVEVVIEVNEGPISIIRHVRESVFWEQSGEPENVEHEIDQAPYSLFWQQDFIRNLRNSYYAQGYAETDIKVDKIERTPEDGTNWVNLFLEVRTGTKVFLGEVTFEGHEKTKESLIRSRIKMEPAQPLNRIQAEQGRYSLSRLGVFESVDLAFEKNKPHRWDVRYDLEEAKTTDLSLLFGFGSYELLRGGFILSQRNIWGLAHSSKLQAYQSFKSTSGEYIYTMPEFIGKDIDVFINPKYLRREEVSFLREEYGGSIGAQKFFSKINSDVGLRYSFDILNAREIEGAPDIGVTRAEVAAWTINIKHDRRNNPLYPTRGYRVSSKLEVASSLFGGQVDYERVELDGSFHKGFGGGRFLHLGLTHGVVITQGDPATDIPVNKRFFPGGENSIRGYQEGKAAPRNNNGRITGAETYTLGNVELEQALTPAWSIIGFVDALGQSRLIDDYPSNEFLISAGGGVRWKTVVGPVRLEYGHNLNPRADDPSGTIHFSIGFPF